ncbi:outer membrane protein assembly factor BamB family protein [Micromonosporaceae bacterium Da 78-11]
MSRGLVRWVLAGVLTLVAVLLGWRVLAPAELLDTASSPYPEAILREPGVTGRTNVAPLIVDGRIRVYAAKRQVRADAPADAKSVNTARWSFRRWPQQLSGVVAIGRTVISRWSDGELVALDAGTGRITWRTDGPSAPGYAGHRTGAATVWAPPGLHTTGGTVVVGEGQHLSGYDVSTGAERWRTDLPTGCTDGFTTAGGQYVCPTGGYDTMTGAAVASWPPGPFTPVGCTVAASSCAGLRDGSGQGWLTGGPRPERAPALDAAGSTMAGGLVLTVTAGTITATLPSGAPRWTTPWTRSGRILGASADDVLVLTPTADLWLLDLRTGVQRDSFPLRVGTESLAWKPGLYQVTDHQVAIERLGLKGPADPDKPNHYFTVDTDILAAF